MPIHQSTTLSIIYSFAHYYQHVVQQYLANTHALDYNTFSKRSNRAKNPLTNNHETQFYTAAYAMQHYQSFMALLQHHLHVNDMPNTLNIVDYGCGQGIAVLAMLDYLAEHQSPTQSLQLNIHLLEPSATALHIAKELIKARCQALGFSLSLSSQATHLANVQLPAYFLEQQHQTFHLFSNVLDVVDLQLSLQAVVRQIKQINAKQMILASSSNYSNSRKGFCQLSALLTNNAYPRIYERQIEHYSYRVINQCWKHEKSPYLHMIFKLDKTIDTADDDLPF